MSDYYTAAFLRKTSSKTKPWRGILKYADEDGEPRQVSKTFGETVRTKTQAQAALEAWRADMESLRAAPDAGLSTATYVSRYLDVLESTGSVEGSTLVAYRSVATHIRDAFSDVPLRDLAPAQVQEWEIGLLDSGLSPSTVGKAHRLLKQVCKHAVNVHDLTWNPCEPVRPPKRPRTEPNALVADGRARVVSLLDSMGPTPLGTAASLALYAGMRRGEVCGLRWKDVDLERAEVRVSQVIGLRKGGAYVKEPKTGGSRRTIPLAPQLVRVLERRRDAMRPRWREAMLKIGLSASDAAFGNAYVIGHEDGTPASPSVIGKEWMTIAKSLGIVGNQGEVCSFHDLRHSFATAAVSGGADIKSVSSILGHSNAAMTLNIYASADADAKRRAAEIVGAAMVPSSQADIMELATASGE